MDREASRGNKKDKKKGGKRKERGGEEVVVVVVWRAMSHQCIRMMGGWQEGEHCVGALKTLGTTGVSNCRAVKQVEAMPGWGYMGVVVTGWCRIQGDWVAHTHSDITPLSTVILLEWLLFGLEKIRLKFKPE